MPQTISFKKQTDIVQLLKQLGYQLPESEDISAGVNEVLLLSLLMRGLQTFLKQFFLIYLNPDIYHKLIQVEEKRQAVSRYVEEHSLSESILPFLYTTEEQDLIELKSFLETLLVCVSPLNTHNENNIFFTKLLTIRNQEKLTLTSFAGIYTITDLKKLLSSYRHYHNKKQINFPIVIEIKNGDDIITLTYDNSYNDNTKKTWFLFHSKTLLFQEHESDSKLINQIARIFNENSNNTAFNLTTKIYSRESNQRQTFYFLESWQRSNTFKRIHKYNPKKIFYIDDKIFSQWLITAARTGNEINLKHLLLYTDVNDPTLKIAAFTALSQHHLNIVRLLLNAAPQLLNIVYQNLTLITAAVKENDLRMLDVLLSYDYQPDKIAIINNSIMTPLFFAILLGNIDVVKYLIEKGANPQATSIVSIDYLRSFFPSSGDLSSEEQARLKMLEEFIQKKSKPHALEGKISVTPQELVQLIGNPDLSNALNVQTHITIGIENNYTASNQETLQPETSRQRSETHHRDHHSHFFTNFFSCFFRNKSTEEELVNNRSIFQL